MANTNWRGNQDRNWPRDENRDQWGADRGRDWNREGNWREDRGSREWSGGGTGGENFGSAYGGEFRSGRDYNPSRGSGRENDDGYSRDFGDYRGGGYGEYRGRETRDAWVNNRSPYESGGGYGRAFGGDANYSGVGSRGDRSYGTNYGRGEGRDFWDRASDEVSSWFGDDDAERRREHDARQGDSGAQHHVGRGPKGYTRSDERIREDISDRLSDDRYVDASDIEVTVKDREVTLSGTVDSRQAKRHAEDIVERVSGVTHVSNNLRVKSSTTAMSATGANASATGTGASGVTSGAATATGMSSTRR